MKPSKTFTLIELILVVAIVAVLAGAMIPVVSSARSKARASKIILLADTLKVATQKFYADTARLPIEAAQNNNPWDHQLYENSANPSPRWPTPAQGQPIPGWDGPYISHRLSSKDTPYGGRLEITLGIGATIGIANIFVGDVPESDARQINASLDTNEPGAWNTTGNVRYDNASELLAINYLYIKLN
ncbi:MAG: prepilin-type N-terminal cleavage/methylation domain-containing protein [Candidatus Omnitrophica bacterium]|nr:prepilin-type N-terminal cleavage/methylation domain-containing protein [Candidatus Omnitrophota bacterium]